MRLACLLLVLLMPSLALATDLQVTDSRGTVVVIKDATVDYGSLLTSGGTRAAGTLFRKGAMTLTGKAPLGDHAISLENVRRLAPIR